MENTKLYKLLAYSGTLPFIFCVVLKLLNFQSIGFLGNTDHILLTYALVIVNFMAGIHWATQLYQEKITCRINLFILSNFVALASWFSYLIFASAISIIVFIISFTSLLAIDYELLKESVITKDYFKTRLFVTLIVLASLSSYILIS